MNIKVLRKLEAGRIELGLASDDVAEKAGLSKDEYSSAVMFHEAEAYDLFDSGAVKKLCAILGFNFLELFEIPCAFCDSGKVFTEDYKLPRNELLKKKRLEKNLTQDQLADLIGFETVAVVDFESNSDYLEKWPLELIENLSKVLDIPVQILVGAKCKNGH